MGQGYDEAIDQLKRDIISKGNKASYKELFNDYNGDRDFLEHAVRELYRKREIIEPKTGFLSVVVF